MPNSWRIGTANDAIYCRGQALRVAKEFGFSDAMAWAVATAVSELVTNVIKFAGSGRLTLREVEEEGRKGVELVVEDRGPGIADIEAALQDGFTEGHYLPEDEDALRHRRGLGSGLGAVRRLMDTLDVTNIPEGGLRVVARKYLPTKGRR